MIQLVSCWMQWQWKWERHLSTHPEGWTSSCWHRALAQGVPSLPCIHPSRVRVSPASFSIQQWAVLAGATSGLRTMAAAHDAPQHDWCENFCLGVLWVHCCVCSPPSWAPAPGMLMRHHQCLLGFPCPHCCVPAVGSASETHWPGTRVSHSPADPPTSAFEVWGLTPPQQHQCIQKCSHGSLKGVLFPYYHIFIAFSQFLPSKSKSYFT